MKRGRNGPITESTCEICHVRVILLDQTEAAQIGIGPWRQGDLDRSSDSVNEAGIFLIGNQECRRSSVGKLTGLLNTLLPISIILPIMALVDRRFATRVANRGLHSG